MRRNTRIRERKRHTETWRMAKENKTKVDYNKNKKTNSYQEWTIRKKRRGSGERKSGGDVTEQQTERDIKTEIEAEENKVDKANKKHKKKSTHQEG